VIDSYRTRADSGPGSQLAIRGPRRHSEDHAKGTRERGQILPIVVLALLALLGVSAFAIDVAYAYYAKRQLQAATDAAALAGAQDLPDTATAVTTASHYATVNTPENLASFHFTYQAKCTNTSIIAAGCDAAVNPNALVVSGRRAPTPGSRESSASITSTSPPTRPPAARARRRHFADMSKAENPQITSYTTLSDIA
jgi:hypothetical protein